MAGGGIGAGTCAGGAVAWACFHGGGIGAGTSAPIDAGSGWHVCQALDVLGAGNSAGGGGGCARHMRRGALAVVGAGNSAGAGSGGGRHMRRGHWLL